MEQRFMRMGRMVIAVLAALWVPLQAETLARRWLAPESADVRAASVPGAKVVALAGPKSLQLLRQGVEAYAKQTGEAKEELRLVQAFADFFGRHRLELVMVSGSMKQNAPTEMDRAAIAAKFGTPVAEGELKDFFQKTGESVQVKDGMFLLSDGAAALLEGGRLLIYSETPDLLREIAANVRARKACAFAQTEALPEQDALLLVDLRGMAKLDETEGEILAMLSLELPETLVLGVDERGAVLRVPCRIPADADIYVGFAQIGKIAARQMMVAERAKAEKAEAAALTRALAALDRVALRREGCVAEARYTGNLLEDFLPACMLMHRKSLQTSRVNDMKQIVLMMILYADDHDDKYPAEEKWREALKDYLDVKLNQSLDKKRLRYYGGGRNLADVKEPSRTILLVDLDAQDGKYVVAFFDGHVEALDAAALKQYGVTVP